MKYIFVVESCASLRNDVVNNVHAGYPKAQIVPCECNNELLRCLHVTFKEVISKNPRDCVILLGRDNPFMRNGAPVRGSESEVLQLMAEDSDTCPVYIVDDKAYEEDLDSISTQLYDRYKGHIKFESGVQLQL